MQERPLCFTPGNRILICGSVLINFSFLILVLLFFWPGSPPLQFSSQYQSWLMGKYQCLASSYVLVHLCHVAASCCATPWSLQLSLSATAYRSVVHWLVWGNLEMHAIVFSVPLRGFPFGLKRKREKNRSQNQRLKSWSWPVSISRFCWAPLEGKVSSGGSAVCNVLPICLWRKKKILVCAEFMNNAARAVRLWFLTGCSKAFTLQYSSRPRAGLTWWRWICAGFPNALSASYFYPGACSWW